MPNAIIIYGSLLKQSEREAAGLSYEKVIPIRLNGYKRLFNQRPKWRKGVGLNIAVLNAKKTENCWMNGLAIIGLDDESMERLDYRECGYDKVLVENNQIVWDNNPSEQNNYIYCGKKGGEAHDAGDELPEISDEELLPNLEYLNICLVGCKDISQEFYEDFISSTYLANGESLDGFMGG